MLKSFQIFNLFLFQARPLTQPIRRTDGTASKASTSSSTKRLMGMLNTIFAPQQTFFSSYFSLHYVLTHISACILRSTTGFGPERKFSWEAPISYFNAIVAFEKELLHIHVAITAPQLHHHARVRRNLEAPFALFTLFHINEF